jgi:hypothetical protein
MTTMTYTIGDIFKFPAKTYVDGKLVDSYEYYMLLPHLTRKNEIGLYIINPITLKYQAKYRKTWNGSIPVNNPEAITQEEFDNILGIKFYSSFAKHMTKMSEEDIENTIQYNNKYKIKSYLSGEFFLETK